jgi:predicted RND superfamily exporter protein
VLVGLYEVVDAVLRHDAVKVHAAGIGLVYDELNTASFRDTPLFLSLCILLVGIALFITFRRVGPVLMALLSVLLAMGLLMGLYALLGEELNMVTAILPTLMIIVGVADTVHLVQHRAARLDEPLEKSLAFIVRPCLYTSLTTAVGFGSLMSAQMQVIKDLGKYAAIGVIIALGVSVIVAAAMLSVERLAPRPRSEDETSSGFLDRQLAALGRLATGKPLAVIGVAALITLLGAYGISRIVVDTYSIDFFKASNPVRIDSDAIEASYGRYMPLEFAVSAPKSLEAGVQEPEFLNALAAWQAEAKAKDLAGWSSSVADVVARLNQVLREGGPEDRVVPKTAGAVAQAMLMYESQPGNERLSLTDPSYRIARVTFGVPMTSAKEWGKLITSLEAIGKKHLPKGARVERGGYLPLYVRMMDYVVDSQVSSFAIAYFAVFMLLGLLFRSLTLAAVAMIPNLLPIFVTLGLMGLLGVRLDVATVTIAAVVIGIVVDDTIHFLHRFKKELHTSGPDGADGDYGEAARRTLRGAGPALVSTSLILAIGFLVLTLASVKSIIYFGLLSAVAMVAALFADLVLLPAILVSVKPRIPR